MRSRLFVAVVAVLSFFAISADAGMLLVSQQEPIYGSYGYGLSSWSSFTNILNNQFGAANITVQNTPLTNLASMLTYDAIMVTPSCHSGIGSCTNSHPVLTAAEISNLQGVAATGRRVLLFGENDGWTAWNNSILAIAGGAFGQDIVPVESDLTPVVSNSLTAGVSLLRQRADGAAVGGTSLFNENLATLWGANQNVLTILSINAFDGSYITMSNNTQFAGNVAAWLNNSTAAPIPEPATYALVGLGLAFLAFVRRK